MAQAVAYAAQQLNIPCRLYVPDSAPQIKIQAIQNSGAEIIQMPYEDVWKIVRGDIKVSDDRIFIHPALNSFLLKGYAKIAEEILEAMPDADAIVIPFGVGGLSLGISKTIRKYNPEIAIYTCEPETACPLKTSLQMNKPVSVHRAASFVDAIGTPEVLADVFHQNK
jgi:threonine dehydratase